MKKKVHSWVLLAASFAVGMTSFGQGWWSKTKIGGERGESNWGKRSFGSRNYADCQDFVDKYVRDDIRDKLDGFNAKWGFADVKLTNVKSELQAGYAMPVEEITCEVTLVPKYGSEHFILIPWPSVGEERKKTLSGQLHGYISRDRAMTNVISAEWLETASKRVEAVRISLDQNLISNPVKAPIGVPLKAQDLAGIFVATVHRAKDGEGVYRPVRSNGMRSELIVYKSKLRCSFNWRKAGSPFGDTLVTAERLKELGGVSFADEEGLYAIRAKYNTHVGNFAAAFAELVKMSDEYKIIVENRIGNHFVHDRSAKQNAVAIIQGARKRLSDARRDMSECKNEIRDLTYKLGNRKRDLPQAEARLPQTVVDAEKERAKLVELRKTYGETGRYISLAKSRVQAAERRERDCRARVESLRKEIEILEVRLTAERNRLESASAECATAEADLKKTVLEQTKRLEVAMKDAAKRMDEAWKAIAVPSRQDHW